MRKINELILFHSTLENMMKKFIVLLTTVVLFAACSSQNDDSDTSAEEQMSNADMEQTATHKRDISTAALVKIDPAIQEYDDRVAETKANYTGSDSDGTKQDLVEAYLAFADYMTYESTVSPREGKYHRALIEYRHALELDPGNAKAASEIAQIEDIYRSMNRPVPGE